MRPPAIKHGTRPASASARNQRYGTRSQRAATFKGTSCEVALLIYLSFRTRSPNLKGNMAEK
jgi:hypothetical protein